MKRLTLLTFVVTAALLTACGANTAPDDAIMGQAGDLVIREAWVRPAVLEGGNGAGYMLIENTGDTADRLIGADASFAEVVEVHETFEVDQEMEGMAEDGDMEHDMGGMMGMRQVEAIEIAPGETVALEVGGYHVMLIGIAEPPTVGDTVEITLIFENAGEVTIEAPVREQPEG